MSMIDSILGDAWIPPAETPCFSDPEGWVGYVNDRTKASRKMLEEARYHCNVCPFAKPCLAEALKFESGKGKDYRYGIWAGTTPLERYAMDPLKDVVQHDLDDEELVVDLENEN